MRHLVNIKIPIDKFEILLGRSGAKSYYQQITDYILGTDYSEITCAITLFA